MSSAGPAPNRVPADTLYAIASLELRARTIAEGLLAGAHRSLRFGSSTEFAEHKVYSAGDDLRHLDWRAFARMDRYYVRRYEEETNLDVVLVVDASGSMAYGGGAQGAFTASKLEVAKTLAAALAFLAHRRSDAGALSVFAGGEDVALPPRARADQLHAIFDALEGAEAGGPTEALATFEAIASRLSRRALVIVLSDLLDAGAEALAPLGVLRQRGADVIVMHTLDRDELDFPFDGVVRFEDLEGDRVAQLDAPAVRRAYLDELDRFLGEIREECGRRDLRYHLVPTDLDPAIVLAEVLQANPGGDR